MKKDSEDKKVFTVVAKLAQALGELDGPDRVIKNAVLRAGSTGNTTGADLTLFAVDWSLDDFLKLPRQAQCNVLREAAINFCCRSGKASEKLQGKVLSIEASAVYLESIGSRDTGPSKQDRADAEQRLAVVKNDAHKDAHNVDEDSELYGNVDHFIVEHVKAIGARNAAKYAGLQWGYSDSLSPLDNLSALYRACRLWKPKVD